MARRRARDGRSRVRDVRGAGSSAALREVAAAFRAAQGVHGERLPERQGKGRRRREEGERVRERTREARTRGGRRGRRGRAGTAHRGRGGPPRGAVRARKRRAEAPEAGDGPRGSRAAARRGSERAADTRVSELRRLIARGVHDPVRRMRPRVPHVLPLPADGGAPARGLVLPQLRRRRERRVRLWVQLREDVHDGRFRKVVPGLRRGVLRRGGRPREDVHRRHRGSVLEDGRGRLRTERRRAPRRRRRRVRERL
mmetsp:Transcript_14246/g.51226  ORF Transcript_14246/g.51226 Transcript_14246/m.51226 type:complete len:255 (+) Transcript_14246:443-1207(+)